MLALTTACQRRSHASCRQCASSVATGVVTGPKAVWINAPCTNQRPAIAIRQHECGRGSSRKGAKKSRVQPAPPATIHEKAEGYLKESTKITEGFKKSIEKEKIAIIKRMRAMDHIIRSYDSFSSFEELVQLLADTGAFQDCPMGKEPASMGNGQASYSSRTTAVELTDALAHSTRAFWLPKIQASAVGSIAADETGDNAHRTQLCTMYKILLPTSEPCLVYAGIEDMPRGTAEFIFNSLKYRMDLDGLEMEDWLATSCFDTCSTMFG